MIMKTPRQPYKSTALLSLALGFAWSAAGSFHTWKVNEIYSNPDGSVQFIELREASGLDNQHLLPGHSITCTGPGGTTTFNFPANLPSSTTANKFFIIGTSNLVSMPGGLKPDYMFTNAGPFLSLTTGSINFAGQDSVNYTNPPTDGKGAMIRSGANMIPVATNGPVNFVGAFNFLVPLKFFPSERPGNDLVISFATATGTNGTAGPNYAVQTNGVPNGTGWGTLTNIAGNGNVHSLTNPIGEVPAQFFRLRVP
jgi:hypothetical protein